MAKKTTKEMMEEKAKKLNNVSPSQALFGMTPPDNKEEKGTETQKTESEKEQSADTTVDVVDERKVEDQNEIQEEETEPVPNEDNARAEKKHQLLSLKKQKVEDTHTRSTFLVRNDLLKRFNKLASGKHGFKTEFINYAIESALIELEEELKK